MPETLQHDRSDIFRVELRGGQRTGALARCPKQLMTEMGRIGPVKLLFVLEAFDGWELDATSNDLSFYVGHGDCIERIAIGGPERWRSHTLMVAGADLREADARTGTVSRKRMHGR